MLHTNRFGECNGSKFENRESPANTVSNSCTPLEIWTMLSCYMYIVFQGFPDLSRITWLHILLWKGQGTFSLENDTLYERHLDFNCKGHQRNSRGQGDNYMYLFSLCEVSGQDHPKVIHFKDHLQEIHWLIVFTQFASAQSVSAPFSCYILLSGT